jgi:hypothetical protein
MRFGGESNGVMDRRIRYHPLFDCDVREAAAWYDRRSQGLGDAFVQSVRVCVDQVIVDPDRFALASTGCRYLRLRRFPYVVLFEIVNEELILLGVLHTARSMNKWRDRQIDSGGTSAL